MVYELAVSLRRVLLSHIHPDGTTVHPSLSDHSGDNLFVVHQSLAGLDVDHLEETHHCFLLGVAPPHEEVEGEREG